LRIEAEITDTHERKYSTANHSTYATDGKDDEVVSSRIPKHCGQADFCFLHINLALQYQMLLFSKVSEVGILNLIIVDANIGDIDVRFAPILCPILFLSA
jgi:hypothetical protein